MRLALFQPDIPQNLGAAIRLCACLDIGLDVIEPCGFPLSDRAVRRASMDYAARAALQRHPSWEDFLAARRGGGRILLLTTRAAVRHIDFSYAADDVLLVGRESAGAPDEVHAAADARLGVPMAAGARSLNVAIAASLVLGEALRQTAGFPAGAGAQQVGSVAARPASR